MRNEGVLKNWFGLFENAWFPWQPITDLMGKRELIALLNLFSWCLVMVERLFLAVSQGCLQFVIVVFPDHAHLLFLGMGVCIQKNSYLSCYFS